MLTSSSLAGLSHAVGLAVGDHGGGVLQEPVEHRDGGGVLGQEPAPVLEGVVGGDAEGSAFVGGGDEPEEQLSTGVVQRGEPDLGPPPGTWTRGLITQRLAA